MNLLQSSWFVCLIGSLSYLGTTVALIKPAQFAGFHREDSATKKSAENDPSWKFRNPEFDQWVNEIKREREALALREQQVQELQTRLETERLELTAVTQQVFQLQAEFDRNVVRFKAQEGDNLKRQIKIIGSMSPEGAATMLGEMADDDLVRMLVLMKADQSGQLLEAISKKSAAQARRAALIMERMQKVIPPSAAGRGNPPS